MLLAELYVDTSQFSGFVFVCIVFVAEACPFGEMMQIYAT